MIASPWQVQLRWLLVSAAADLGYPEGYAPSEKRYHRWAVANGRRTAHQVRKRTPGGHTGWSAVVEHAGLRPSVGLYVPRSRVAKPPLGRMTPGDVRRVMVEDLRRVAREIGKPGNIPPPRVYRQRGRFHERQVLQQFTGHFGGSWHDVACEVNLMPNRKRNGHWTREVAVEAYQRAAKLLGRTPGGPGLTCREIGTHIASIQSLRPLVGGVNEFAVLSGFEPWPQGLNRRHANRGLAA